MVDMRLFRSRVFAGGTVTMMLWAFGIFGIYFFTSIYLQTILGFSPTKAGLAFVPMALCMALFAGLAGPVSRRAAAEPDRRARHGGDGWRAVPVREARRRRDLREPDAGLPDLRRGGRADERAADQRGTALDATGAVRSRLGSY